MAETVSNDIYDLGKTVLDLEKKYTEIDDEQILLVSSYGNMGAQFTKMLKNSNFMAAEYANECLLIKAKHDNTILTNAINYSIEDINAIPAVMNVNIGFVERELLDTMTNGTLTIPRTYNFNIGKYNFHLDHDVIIQAQKVINEGYMYTARYVLNSYSPNFSKTQNPYLDPPFRILKNNETFICIQCILVQTTITDSEHPIISNNILENKTVDFDIDDNLAAFEVIVQKSDNSEFNLVPIYEGMPLKTDLFCYYNYLTSDIIRLKFDSDSYAPKNGDKIKIRVHTTDGDDGNITYRNDVICTLSSEDYDFNGLECWITCEPATGGKDMMSIDQIRNILPRQAFSNGVITTDADIDNYFNSMSQDNKMKFKKKRHNQQERLYYSFLLAKDENEYIIPTNTIDMVVYDDELDELNNRLTITPDTKIGYTKKGYGVIADPDKSYKFEYAVPTNMIINKDILSMSYYLNDIDGKISLSFSYINNNSFLQFISMGALSIKRNFLENNKYVFDLVVTQNSNIDKNIITMDKDGNILDSKLKPVLVLTPDKDHSYYVYGKINYYDDDTFRYGIRFEIESDCVMDDKNRIRIDNVYVGGSSGNNTASVYIDPETGISIYMYLKLDENLGSNQMVKPLYDEGYTLTNIYSSKSNISLIQNLSNIINSTVKVSQEGERIKYSIKSVPVVKYSYFQDTTRCNNLINILRYRKAYIDNALIVLENAFEIDFKFMNTYGPSNTFRIGYDSLKDLDRVNLSLNFVVQLKEGVDSNNIITFIKQSIKDYIEDIDDIATSIHMSNLLTKLNNEYKNDIYFIDFVGLNDYTALDKYIIKKSDEEDIDQVPEMLCINLVDDNELDINIKTI